MVQFDDSFAAGRLSDLRNQEEERLVQSMAPQYGYEYIDLHGYTINPEAMALLPEDRARAAEVVGFELNQKKISIAAKRPQNPKTQALLQSLQEQKYTPLVYMCSSASLEHAYERYADITNSLAEKKGVFEISAEDILRLTSSIKTVADVQKNLKEINTINNTRRVSETLELIFAGGLALGASDIHIEPEESAVRIRYRFDGVLHDVADIEHGVHKRIMSRLKLLSGMILNTKAEAQDGRFTFDVGDREIEVRSSVIPGATAESIVMRLLDPSVASFSMEKIQLNKYMKAAMSEQLKKPNGLIITTGPTGSGKTTALYAFLQETHTEGVKIITIENPVEYKLEGIVQTQTDGDYTFASGLRALLRQDPDVIMVGEIRDREVAETAIHAAQTGHLVFSTLHTNSAVGGFPRLVDLGVDPRILGSSINIIIGQRLVRRLCEDCKTSYDAEGHDKDIVEFVMKSHPHPTPLNEQITLYTSSGCEKCGGSGFKGRMGIFEAIIMDDAVEEVVIRDPREHIILEAAKPQGIPSMREDGIDKALSGVTSLKELGRVIELPNPQGYQNKPLDPVTSVEEIQAKDDFLSHVI